ncbi:sentrin-specific protease 2 isoform X2 [Cheilinus undulatus]|uniref:sentrin-specific protease 2 isoform X2 n=1 Tax=Cheilinus undulatus TaxID=241271 RepID=UPI001BD5F085|nr:sentrin-specific protease 2 isoform X2 [Cheilinus undulatus]
MCRFKLNLYITTPPTRFTRYLKLTLLKGALSDADQQSAANGKLSQQKAVCVVDRCLTFLSVCKIVLAGSGSSVTFFSYLSGMYGWIVDGISSLFESVSGQNPSELPGKGNVAEEVPTRPAVKARAQQPESHGRPAKRNYQSVDVEDGVCQRDPVQVKRRRRDVVISFVKKTVAGVAGLLRLRNPLITRCEKPRQYEEPQAVTLMGIDELHTSWLNSSEWRMNKPVGGINERGGKNPFQNSSPPLVRKYSGAGLSAAGHLDRGVDRERRSSLQLLPSRPALRVGTANPDPFCNGFGYQRCYKPSLTVEETIKQDEKERYKRLLEMVTEKYNKSQPLPFIQTKPHDAKLLQSDPKPAAPGKVTEPVIRKPAPGQVTEPVSRKTGYTAPGVFSWRNASAVTDRRSSLTFSKTFSGAFEETQPVRCTKPVLQQKQAAELDLSTEVATRLNLVDRETSAATIPEAHTAHTAHSRHADEDIPRLTKEMAAEVSRALAQSDPNLVLSAAFKLRITQRDLATLQEGSWLNDEVINFYLSLVMERCAGEAAGLKVYTFSTFFFPKLRGGRGGQAGGHSAVKRWTKAVDLFLYDLILVPLHLGVHWALAVIDFKSKTVKSYDSMGQRHDDICSLLLLYLKEEHKAKKGRELDSTKWTFSSLRANEIPQQRNGSDCGVFACKYADYIARGRPLTFKQCHMPLFRKLMIWEIINQQLL